MSRPYQHLCEHLNKTRAIIHIFYLLLFILKQALNGKQDNSRKKDQQKLFYCMYNQMIAFIIPDKSFIFPPEISEIYNTLLRKREQNSQGLISANNIHVLISLHQKQLTGVGDAKMPFWWQKKKDLTFILVSLVHHKDLQI